MQLLALLTEILQPPPMSIPSIPPAAAVLEAIIAVAVAVPVATMLLIDMPE
jgi:hypothetical protein